MLENIHVFHTNDLHSHFENWPRMQTYIKEQRQLLAAKGEASFLFDIGDHIDRFSIFTEATLGKGNVQLLNEAQYDVVTIGNNEGITMAHEDLFHLYDEANFDVVVANMRALSVEQPKWLKLYTILTTASEVKIAVLGATAQYELFYRELGWDITDPHEVLIQLAEELKSQVDIIVCLSHLGKTEDELLAQKCPAIDVIFGAHTHHILQQGELVNGVMLTGGGKFGYYTGHLTLTFDHANRKIIKKQEELIENDLLPPVEDELKFVANLYEQGQTILKEPLTTNNKTYTKEWFHYSPLSNLFAKSLLDYTNADCAMFNAGIFIDSLHRGHISAYDFHKILPHPINACIVELTGHELIEVLQQSKNEEWPQLQLKGLGFRGIVFGKMLTYGFELNINRELLMNGQLVDLNGTYKLATLDMYTFGFFFPSFKYATKQYLLPLFLRDIFRDYIIRKNE